MRVYQRFSDLLHDRGGIGQHVIVPEAQNSVTLLQKKLSPPLIRICLRDVLTAIELHDKLPFRATKIGNVPAYGMLTTKFCPVHLPGPQPGPELTLCIGLVYAQAS